MTNEEKIIAYLTENKHQYCDDCIAKLCNVRPRQQVNSICNNSNRIKTQPQGTCFDCGKTKITRSVAQNDSEPPICDDAHVKTQSEALKRLQHIGFQKAGRWVYTSEKIDFVLERLDGCAPVLYAFAVDGSIKYIGESTKTLKERMQQYKTPGPTQSTNNNNNARIKKELEAGKSVEIYAFVDYGLLSYGGFIINLARGLETNIIEDLQPEWSRQ